MMPQSARSLLACLPALGLVALLAGPAQAQPASAAVSPWAEGHRSRVRLMAGTIEHGTLRAGVEIDLNDGWKTYWRYPGDSGVPPQFDFSRSENVARVEVLWPAPRAFSDGSGTSIGYRHNVVFPLRVTPRDPAKPVTLRLALDYAVCEKLCVPEQARAELPPGAGDSAVDSGLKAAEARVPAKAEIGAEGLPAVRAVREMAAKDRPRVMVEVAAPAGVSTEVFAEGPSSDWALPLPTPQPQMQVSGNTRTFSFDIDGVPAGASAKGAMLTLTVVAGDRAIEVPARLD